MRRRRAGRNEPRAHVDAWYERLRWSWDVALANRGLLVDHLRRHLPWVLRSRDEGLYDVAMREGLLLVRQAAFRYDDAGTTLGGFVLSVLRAQLVHRVREAQGLQGAPPGSFSLDAAEDGGPAADVADTRPPPSLPEDRIRAGTRVRAAVGALCAVVRRRVGPFGRAVERAALVALMVRRWGAAPRYLLRRERLVRLGVTYAEVDALDAAWTDALRGMEEGGDG